MGVLEVARDLIEGGELTVPGLDHAHGASVSGPFVDVLEQVLVQGGQVRRVVGGRDGQAAGVEFVLSGGDSADFNASELVLTLEAELVAEDVVVWRWVAVVLPRLEGIHGDSVPGSRAAARLRYSW